MSDNENGHNIKNDYNTNTNKMDTSESNMPHTSAEVSASTHNFRLPSFWTNNPKIWFITAEVQFVVNKITKDELKYSQILMALPPEACMTVLDLLEKPPINNKYETLKAALIDRNSPSEEKQLETLLDKREIGDKNPSEVLRQIKSLAGDNFTLDLIKKLWIRKLPEYIRIALVPQQETTLVDELAKMADKLHEAVAAKQGISSVQRKSRATQKPLFHHTDLIGEENHLPSTSTASIVNRLTRLERLVARNRSTSRSSSRGQRFQSRTRYRSTSRPRQGRQLQGICWYHQKFGRMAQKCSKPCHFKKLNTEMHTEDKHPNK